MELPPNYPDTFPEIINHVLKFEGGLSTNPADPGGITKYGISQRAFPKLNIRKLTKAQAIEIYYTHYWLPLKAELIPPHLRFAVFDCAVNCGVRQAVLLLQNLAGVTADGIMGPRTAKAAESVTVAAYLEARAEFYRGLAAKRRASRGFLSGWLLRLRAIARIIGRALSQKG